MSGVIIAGGSLAGLRAAQTLRRRGYEGLLTIIDTDEDAGYDRPQLSKAYLWNSKGSAETRLDAHLPEDVQWLRGRTLTGLDTLAREVVLEAGERVPFTSLVVATGAMARPHPWRHGLEGVHSLRTLADARALRTALAARPRVVVIGGGLIGCEVASTARNMGCDVHIVEALEGILGRALGDVAGRLIAELHRAEGTRIDTGVTVTNLNGDEHIESVQLADGRSLPADLVVTALGAVPSTAWLEGSGLELDDGVLCDQALRTNIPGIVAAGDVARWADSSWGNALTRTEHWSNAAAQGVAAALTLLRPDDAPGYLVLPSVWSHQCGVKIQSIGWPGRADTPGTIRQTPGCATIEYRRAGALVGVTTWGDASVLTGYQRDLRTLVAAS